MDIIFNVLFTVLLVSAIVRHIVRTFSFIVELKEKQEERRIKKYSK